MKKEIGLLVLLSLVMLSSGILSTSFAENAATDNRITRDEVINAQKTWGDAIVSIGNAYSSKGDYKALTAKTVDTLYGFDEGTVLFKPTKASKKQFRLTEEDALSYFVTGIVHEDHGFAIQPWSKVRFENSGIIIDTDSAIAMGNYYFTDAKTGKEGKVEFTFGYFKDENGKLLINVHHSSYPYDPTY